MTPTIIVIAGPSGVGKSGAGLCLARRTGGEIVSCDAMQVYREVNIACDKPSVADRQTVPHHLLDVASVTEVFDAARYRALAAPAVEGILACGRTPVIVGGSGMYLAVLLDGIFEGGVRDPDLRRELEARASVPEGLAALAAELREVDPAAAARIHPHDAKRVVRALEVAKTRGEPISALQKQRSGLADTHRVRMFGLRRAREAMYARVEARIDRMFESGLVDEVRALAALPLSRTAATLIGIPEVMGYLNGSHDLDRAKYLMKLNTRHYVKRQMTWFRRDPRIQWIDAGEGQTSEDIAGRMTA